MRNILIMAIILVIFVDSCDARKARKKRVHRISNQNVNVFANINIDKLWNAICKKESGNNPNAIGDGGKAVGIAQIWKEIVIDCNAISREKFSYDDRYSPSKSKTMFILYLQRYGLKYYQDTGKLPTYEIFSRMWNGGPYGYTYPVTKIYWNDIRKKI